MFKELEKINERPEPFQFYTASDLWTDQHTSQQMLSYHLNKAIDVSSRNELLKKFYTILKPGGSVVLDVYSLVAFEKREEVSTHELNQLNGSWSTDKYYGFLNTFKYDSEKVVLDKYTIIESDRTRTVYNWLQHFAPEDLEREFLEVGFTINELYSDVAGSPFDKESSEFAVVARRV